MMEEFQKQEELLKHLVSVCVLEFLMKGGKADEAIEVIDQKIAETDNQNAREYLEEAKRCLTGGNYDKT